jgi:hypothetical protein
MLLEEPRNLMVRRAERASPDDAEPVISARALLRPSGARIRATRWHRRENHEAMSALRRRGWCGLRSRLIGRGIRQRDLCQRLAPGRAQIEMIGLRVIASRLPAASSMNRSATSAASIGASLGL